MSWPSDVAPEEWMVRFNLLGPATAGPRLKKIAHQRILDPDYHMEGRSRSHHRHCTFQYTLSGRGIFRAGDTVHEVSPGEGFLNEAADPGTAYWYPEDGTEPWEVLWVMFLGATEIVRQVTSNLGHIYSLPVRTPVLRDFQHFSGSQYRVEDVSLAEAGHPVLALLDALVQSKLRDTGSSKRHLLVRRAMMVVRRELEHGVSVSMVAGRLNISREHLTRVFKRHTGVTPSGFIREEKMQYACDLLDQTALTCAEVGRRLGYGSAPNFIRAFKKVIGTTPGRFRRGLFS